MSYFPLFIQLEGRRCLVAGGGAVGLRKAGALLRSGAQVTAVSPRFCGGFDGLSGVVRVERPFCSEDLKGVFLAVAATDDRQVNQEIARLCKERNIPVDVADSLEECGFLFPALVQRGEVTVGITTGGGSPMLSGRVRDIVDKALPPDLGELERRMAALRRGGLDRAGMQGELDRSLSRRPEVYLVGAGCGDAGLITWRALELLAGCDVLIYDRLANPELLELTRPECVRLYVGKQAGRHYASQEEINRLLLEQAVPGRRVVRLKGGDPFVFGRGGEEAEILLERGIPFEVVPGVTSAVAAPAWAGIPVTHRNLARSFHVITGHTAQGAARLDFDALARLEGTLIFLMGLGAAQEICAGLIGAGKAPDTPAAAISNGTLPQQQTVRASLADLPQRIREAELPSPAVLVVGDVAALELKSSDT